MDKFTVQIEGMACGMCEAHIADVIRRTFPTAKKVKASRKKGEATFLFDGGLDDGKLKEAIEATGYGFVSVRSEPLPRRGLFKK